MKLVRLLFLLFFVGGFSVLLYLLAPEGVPLGEMEGRRSIGTGEDIRIEGIRFTEWKGGDVRWRLEAEVCRYFQERHRAELEGVETWYASEGGEWFRLQARNVVYDTATRGFEAAGNVRGESDRGYRFRTGRLAYVDDGRTVQTTDQVAVEKDRLSIVGIGMNASLRDHALTLVSGVRAVFVPDLTGAPVPQGPKTTD